MKKKLILHIGAHKTGTTSIQRFLHHNRNIIKDSEISYVTSSDDIAHLHDFLTFDPQKDISQGFSIKSHSLAKKLASASGKTVIGSSENFSFVFRPEEIVALSNELRLFFFETTIVCYIRRQDRHIISHHQEGAKPYRIAEEKIWGNSTNSIPEYNESQPLYLNYEKRLSMWESAFGRDSVIVRPFENGLLKNDDAIDDFTQVVGLDISHMERLQNQNESLGLAAAKIGHIMNEIGVPGAIKNSIISSIQKTKKQRPSRDAARTLYSAYRESNRILNDRLRVSNHPYIFNDDFSDYPEIPDEEWREDDANQAIKAVFTSITPLNSTLSSLNADDFRDAALALENKNIHAALKMMEVAHMLRPQGKFIKEKLEKLRNSVEPKD